MWKLFASIISEEIYSHQDDNGLLPEEQKGCRKGSRGTKDQLPIDKAIIKNCKRRNVGLSMGWIDYKKIHDYVSNTQEELIKESVAENVRHWYLFR